MAQKLSSSGKLLRRLACSGWEDGAKTLQMAAFLLIYSTAEYCAPFWCRCVHTRLIHSALKMTLCALSLDACVLLQRTTCLSFRYLISWNSLFKSHSFLANCSILDHEHLLYDHLVRPLDARQQRLKSRRPFMPVKRKRLDNASKHDICVSQ